MWGCGAKVMSRGRRMRIICGVFVENRKEVVETSGVRAENVGLHRRRESLDVVSHDVDHLAIFATERHHYDG